MPSTRTGTFAAPAARYSTCTLYNNKYIIYYLFPPTNLRVYSDSKLNLLHCSERFLPCSCLQHKLAPNMHFFGRFSSSFTTFRLLRPLLILIIHPFSTLSLDHLCLSHTIFILPPPNSVTFCTFTALHESDFLFITTSYSLLHHSYIEDTFSSILGLRMLLLLLLVFVIQDGESPLTFLFFSLL